MHIAREHRWKFCYLADMLHSDGVRVSAVTATATASKEVVEVSLVLYLRAEKRLSLKLKDEVNTSSGCLTNGSANWLTKLTRKVRAVIDRTERT